MMKQLPSINYNLQTVQLDSEFSTNLEVWLTNYVAQHPQTGLRWLLAHADDGVVWGEIKKTSEEQDKISLSVSSTAFPDISPRLDGQTLQQLRLFGTQGELFIWREDKAFRARWLDETTSGFSSNYFDEAQILWGDRPGNNKNFVVNGYSLIAEGQGLYHAVPLEIPVQKFGTKQNPRRPLRLGIRHYLSHSHDTCQTRIFLSRLIDLYIV